MSKPRTSGAWPSIGRPWNAASFARHAGSLASTPGKFMNSASPSTFGWSASGSRSPISSRAPEVSRCVAGTQLESWTRRSIAVVSDKSRKYCRPVTPSTLLISCGSQIAVVTPWRSTQRSNWSGVISDDSTCRWVSMKPGTITLPATSISRAPLYSPIVPTMRSSQIATSLLTSSPRTRSKIRPPFSTRSAGAWPRPCAMARERKATASFIKGPRQSCGDAG